MAADAGRGEMEMEMEMELEKKKKLGGLKTMPFILANEACERFAASGFHANMITYMTEELHMPMVKASNTLTNFAGTAGITPLIGGLIADSFAGRFWTITGGSIIYQLGMICLTLSAVLPGLRPPPCQPHQMCPGASTWQLWALYISLFLTSLGLGGIRPCVVAFGADQLDMSKSQRAARGWNFFNLYYFCMGLATLTALTVAVYLQDNVGWGWGLGIPTIVMTISVVAFLFGYPLYNKLKPGGSPLTRLTQVIVSAVKKRNAVRPSDPDLLYENKELDAAISSTGRLLHTNQLKFFDRAAIATEAEGLKSDNTPNLWTLSTVHRVEELKSVIRMLPIWSTGILLITASSHQISFTIQQARSMDRHLSPSFEIPPASMAIFNTLSMLLSLAAIDRILVPIARRVTGNPDGITYLQRMGIGFLINIISTLISGFVEIKRKAIAADHGLLDNPQAIIPVSVFWLVPQYSLHGVAESFMLVGKMEFLYDQSPESMRSTAAALYWLAVSVGNYLGTFLVSLIHEFTGKHRNWLPDHNLNRGRLEYYYWLVTGVQVLNLVYFIACAWFYTYKPLEIVDPYGMELAENDTCQDAAGSNRPKDVAKRVDKYDDFTVKSGNPHLEVV